MYIYICICPHESVPLHQENRRFSWLAPALFLAGREEGSSEVPFPDSGSCGGCAMHLASTQDEDESDTNDYFDDDDDEEEDEEEENDEKYEQCEKYIEIW